MSEDQLQQAINLFKEEKKEEASKVLTALLEQEPGNELAWLWLAACTAHPEERRYCLEKALEINPENQKARTALERMQPPAAPAADPAPAPASPPLSSPSEPAAPAAVINTRRRPGRKMSLYRKILIAVFSLLMLVVLGFIFIAFISGAFTF